MLPVVDSPIHNRSPIQGSKHVLYRSVGRGSRPSSLTAERILAAVGDVQETVLVSVLFVDLTHAGTAIKRLTGFVIVSCRTVTELPLLTGEKVGKAFPTFIEETCRLQITFENRALIYYLHLNTV